MIVAALAIIVAAASAQGASENGGADGGADPVAVAPTGCEKYEFGSRNLRRGDCGSDVKTLNWILRSKSFAQGIEPNKRFANATDAGVRRFQEKKSLKVSGVANKMTRDKLAGAMRRELATWYGPGLWGNRLACGGRLRHATMGVAHKKLECGTQVVLRLGDSYLRTRVIDRGPFVRGAKWDLTRRAAKKLGMATSTELHVAVSR